MNVEQTARSFSVVKTNGEKSLTIRTFDTKEEALACFDRLVPCRTPLYWYVVVQVAENVKP